VNGVALMSLDDRVMHAPGPVHGMAMCGEAMRDPWIAGPAVVVDDKAQSWCSGCFDDVMVLT
jgi:hypothetical protein